MAPARELLVYNLAVTGSAGFPTSTEKSRRDLALVVRDIETGESGVGAPDRLERARSFLE